MRVHRTWTLKLSASETLPTHECGDLQRMTNMACGIPLTELVFSTWNAVYECHCEERRSRDCRPADALTDGVVQPNDGRLSAGLTSVQVLNVLEEFNGARRAIYRNIVDTEILIRQSGIFSSG